LILNKIKKTDAYIRRYEGCMTDSVAYYLNLHPENVPLFVKYGKGWAKKFRNWWKRKGYIVRWELCKKPPKRGKHIIVGDSLVWKKYSHMVVYKNGKLAYDPSYPSRWKDNRITHKLVVRKIK
jgi:hypothetical protein